MIARDRDRRVGGLAPDPAVGASRRLLLERLAAGPTRIASAADRVEAVESFAGTPTGEWTAREVVAHLAAVETDVFQPRLAQLAALDTAEPAWAWTEPGPRDTPEAATLDGAVALFAAARSGSVARVAGLDNLGWAGAGCTRPSASSTLPACWP